MGRAYQEEHDSTFGHEGRRYRLNRLFKASHKRLIKALAIGKLDWVLEHCTPDPARVAAADTQIPILVHFDGQRWIVVDGLHRLARARQEGRLLIDTKPIYEHDLARALIS